MASVAADALSLTMLTAGPVAAAEPPAEDLLYVGFGGGFISTESSAANEYVKAGGGAIAGKINRVVGMGSVGDSALTLAGGRTGINFETTEANPFSTTDGLAADRPIRAEMKFTPEADQPTRATLFSAGGNLVVRYDANDKIKFGFSSKTGERWTDHSMETDRPAPGEQHVLHVSYTPDETNTVMSIKIDDREPVELNVPGGRVCCRFG